MTWLRLDDGFTKHPKFGDWTIKERWSWLEVMEYCARYDTDGRVPNDLSIMPRSTTKTLLDKAVESGWCERREDGFLWIHDWHIYNPKDPTKAARQARWRAKRNGPVDADVDAPNGDGDVDTQNRLPRAGAAARGSRPVPSVISNKGVTLELTSRAEARAVPCPNCGAQPGAHCTGVGVQQRESCHAERHAAAIALGAPRLPRSEGSDDANRPKTSDNVNLAMRRWIASPAFDPTTMSVETVSDELRIRERKLGAEVTASQRDAILAYADERITAALQPAGDDEP